MPSEGPLLEKILRGEGPVSAAGLAPTVFFLPPPLAFFFSEGSKIRSWNIRFSFQIFVSLFIWSKTYIRGRTEDGGPTKNPFGWWTLYWAKSKFDLWSRTLNDTSSFQANSFYNNLVVRSWTNCFYVMWTSCYVNFLWSRTLNDTSSFPMDSFYNLVQGR